MLQSREKCDLPLKKKKDDDKISNTFHGRKTILEALKNQVFFNILAVSCHWNEFYLFYLHYLWPWKHNDMKSVASSKSSLKREVCGNKRISLKKKKIFKKQPNLPPRIIRKRGTNRAPDQQRMDLIKIREVINREHKTIEKINKTMSWYFEKKSKIDKCLARLTKNKYR